jgi:Rrf2 family protein
MKVSSKTRYGLRLMLVLGLKYGEGPTLLKDIAHEENISEKYLSQIIIPLRVGGLVKSFRGARGGYMLARRPSQISVRQIIEALDGDLGVVDCVKNPAICQRTSHCVSRDVWVTLGGQIVKTLNGMKLDELVKRHKQREEQLLLYNI